MLDEQFFGNADFYTYLTDNFIPVHAVRGEEMGDALYDKYVVNATPTVVLANANGKEIDRLVGYGPPAEEFKTRIEDTYKGENTLENLVAAYKSNPDDLKSVFKLAAKYNGNYMRDEAAELFNIVLDRKDEAKKVMVPYEDTGETVSVYEHALFLKGDLDTFIAEFPNSALSKEAYTRLARTFAMGRDVAKSSVFFTKAMKRFSDDPGILSSYVQFSARSKTDVKNGLKAAEKLMAMPQDRPVRGLTRNYAELLALNGDTEKLDKVFGKAYAESKLDSPSDLYDYAGFWIEKNKNLDDAFAKLRIMSGLNDSYRSRAATLFMQAGNEQGALDVYGPDFIGAFTDDAGMLNSYASFWGRQEKNLESAMEAALAAVKLDKRPYYYDALSLIYWKSGKFEEAIEAEKEAISLLPEDSRQITRYEQRIEEIKADMKK
ncbi:hypothetical protein ACFL6L_00670 [candidate division KSB1 bacterium]